MEKINTNKRKNDIKIFDEDKCQLFPWNCKYKFEDSSIHYNDYILNNRGIFTAYITQWKKNT